MHDVAVVRYEKSYESLRQAIDEAGGLGEFSSNSKVFVKPNFVTWLEGINFPKYGVLTTAQLIKDTVVILKEHGVNDISLVDGVAGARRYGAFEVALPRPRREQSHKRAKLPLP